MTGTWYLSYSPLLCSETNLSASAKNEENYKALGSFGLKGFPCMSTL